MIHKKALLMMVSTLSSFVSFLIATSVTILAAPQFFSQKVPTYTNELPTPYEYQYKVENPPTNTFYGKNEAGDIAGRVAGSYYVYLPDGRLMTVDYSVNGESGFVPKISFSRQSPYQGRK
uniref:Cuticular protein 121 n=1 Tax=Leptinotarsa decemlineata TaxID=7539 RepID=A0A3S7SJP4_LEPDE|nr:cuticular protein 121 [Leptinotarsa decemlineata]